MINVTLNQIANVLHGTLLGNNIIFHDVVTDTRAITPGCLFVALIGKRFDAHNFSKQIQQYGAGALLVSRKLDVNLPQVIVKDTLLAFYKLSAWVRNQISVRVIAITGSSGKTAVKEMVASILKQCGNTLYTTGNLNNDIGVSMTLLRLTKEHKYAVIELGSNHKGEIAHTVNLTRPEVSLVNNLAVAHLDGLGSLKGIAQEKGNIYTGLLDNGVAVMNADSNDWKNWKTIVGTRKIWRFSLSTTESDFTATNVHKTVSGTKFTLQTPIGNVEILLPLNGYHNITNALAAAALAAAVDAPLSAIKIGLSNIKAIPGRLFPISLTKTQLLLDDSYNSNVGSMIAAMQVLSDMQGYRVMVVGDMDELGNKSNSYHVQVGRIAKNFRLNRVFSIGKFSKKISQESGVGEHFISKKLLISYLKKLLNQYSTITILVKGSRSAAMEDIVHALRENKNVDLFN